MDINALIDNDNPVFMIFQQSLLTIFNLTITLSLYIIVLHLIKLFALRLVHQELIDSWSIFPLIITRTVSIAAYTLSNWFLQDFIILRASSIFKSYALTNLERK